MRSGNPALSDKVFSNAAREAATGQSMTLEGTAIKTGFLLAILCAGAVFTWVQTDALAPALTTEAVRRAGELHPPQFAYGYFIAGMIGGLIASLATMFVPRWSPITAPIYAGFEGLALGAISAIVEYRYPGIALQAVGLTFGTLAALLLAYSTRLVRATEHFKMGIMAATGAIGLVYLVSFVLSFFGIRIPLIHESGLIGIGFSVFVVIIASLNLVLDFDFIETGTRRGAPKYMEWYGGFGLLMTLVWLYIEVLRLLSKLRER
ncbi:MAG: Bax inhibitor-1/YccA family protein [Planctomycetes bacterium]|nr:Bax inhibitor-1/YccA family protein [Planctomycetota bacterium]